MSTRPRRFLPSMVTALLLAGIAYPAMLMATGAPVRSASHWGAPSKPCEAIETADAVFPAGDAGEVTLERSTDALRVVSVAPTEGWDFRIDDGGPDRSVAVVFDKDDARVFFRAAIIDCQVRIRVTGEVVATFTPAPETPTETPTEPAETPAETPAGTPTETPAETPTETPAETPAETPTEMPAETPAETAAPDAQAGTLQAAEAGTVTVELAGERLKVLSVSPAADWTYEVKKEGPSRMVRVRFRSDDARVELVARIHKGKVVVRTRSVSIAYFGGETPAGTRATSTDGDVPTTPVAESLEPEPTTDSGDARTYPAGPAGSITLRKAGTTLEVVSVDTNDGWTSQTLAGGPAEEVSVLFAGIDGLAFELRARLDGGRVRFDARRIGDKPKPVPPAAGTRTVEAGPAGTVTLRHTGTILELVSVQPAEGWTYAAGRQGPGKLVKVLFLSARGGLFLVADVEQGEIDVDMWPVPLDGNRTRDGRDGGDQEARRGGGGGDNNDANRRGDRDGGRDDDR